MLGEHEYTENHVGQGEPVAPEEKLSLVRAVFIKWTQREKLIENLEKIVCIIEKFNMQAYTMFIEVLALSCDMRF